MADAIRWETRPQEGGRRGAGGQRVFIESSDKSMYQTRVSHTQGQQSMNIIRRRGKAMIIVFLDHLRCCDRTRNIMQDLCTNKRSYSGH